MTQLRHRLSQIAVVHSATVTLQCGTLRPLA